MFAFRMVLCAAVLLSLSGGLPAEAGTPKKAAPLAPRSVTLGPDYSQLKIAPPPTGLYLGQYEWVQNDIATFEAAAGRVQYQFGVGDLVIGSGKESSMRLNVVATDSSGKVLTELKPKTFTIRRKI